MMTKLTGIPVENINVGITRIKRFPNGHVFWYYMEVNGTNFRINKDLYKTIRRIITESPN